MKNARRKNLKKEIIGDGITDRKKYKTVKSEYVTQLLARAKKWHVNYSV